MRVSVGTMTSMLLVLGAMVGPALNSQEKPRRLNTMITKLEQQSDAPMKAQDLYTFYDMEHPPFDVATLNASLAEGKLPKDKPVIVRIPAYGWEIEQNQWQVKQVLDQGAQGVMFPRIETPQQALAAIRAMRYPQRPDAKDFNPAGMRGHYAPIAANAWGLDAATYTAKADLWKLDPAGELVPVFLIESKNGVENVRAIAKAMKTLKIGVVFLAGTGDMSIDYCGVINCEIDGKPVPEKALRDKAFQSILAAGKEFDIPIQLGGVVYNPSTPRPTQ